MVGVNTRRTISHVTLNSLDTCNMGYPPKDAACPDWDAPTHLLFVSVSHLRLPQRNEPITTRCRLSVRLRGVTFKGMNHGNLSPIYRPHPNPKTLTRRLTARELRRNPAKFCSCGVSCSESNWLS